MILIEREYVKYTKHHGQEEANSAGCPLNIYIPFTLATKLWFLLEVAIDQLKPLHFSASFVGTVAKPFLINSMQEIVEGSFQESLLKNGADSAETPFCLSLVLFLHAWNEDMMAGVAAAILSPW